jgi:hypothetical protein
MERSEAIRILEAYYEYVTSGGNINEFTEALDYAISSLKTDEAYQLMYEGGEIFTKADMVNMLEDLRQDLIAEANGIAMDCTVFVVRVADIDKVIQRKINELKGK